MSAGLRRIEEDWNHNRVYYSENTAIGRAPWGTVCILHSLCGSWGQQRKRRKRKLHATAPSNHRFNPRLTACQEIWHFTFLARSVNLSWNPHLQTQINGERAKKGRWIWTIIFMGFRLRIAMLGAGTFQSSSISIKHGWLPCSGLICLKWWNRIERL